MHTALPRRRVLRQLAATAALGVGLPTAARAQGRDKLRIGCTLDHSGVEKANGMALHQGALAFFAALNKAGGIAGAQVEVTLADDQFKPEQAQANAQAFAADAGVIALLHPLGTRQTVAVMDTVKEMAVVGPNTGTVALRRRPPANVYWVRANYDQEIDKLVATAAQLGARRLGLVHPTDPLGQSLLAAYKAASERLKMETVVISTTPGTTSPDVEPAARDVARAAPQVVIMGLAGTAPLFVKALRAAGGSSPVYGLSISASTTNIQALGEASRGLTFSIIVPSPQATKYEIVRRYQADMQAAGQTEYSLPSLEGYINARVLAEGLRRAGARPSRESLLAALEGIDNLDLGGFRIGFGKGRREGGSFVDTAIVGQGGRVIS
jgi:ABC-type branched-subunit amino acid transport system substrate-binding protein